jgi:hypothetical protein
MNDDLASRLYHWKFQQATWYLDGEPEEVQELVGALAALLGDSGWICDSQLGIVVKAALSTLLRQKQDSGSDAATLSAKEGMAVRRRRRHG